jgi:hypothetical protein
MPATVTVEIKDTITPKLQALIEECGSPNINQKAGEGVAILLRSHFRKLEASRPNKNKWRRLHFWADCAKSVQNPILGGDRVVISINQKGIAFQRWGKEDVVPVNGAKALTIPADEEAYGKRAGEFGGDLKVVSLKMPDGRRLGALMRKSDSKILYWLKARIHKDPDPTVLPTDAEITNAAITSVESYLRARKLLNSRRN